MGGDGFLPDEGVVGNGAGEVGQGLADGALGAAGAVGEVPQRIRVGDGAQAGGEYRHGEQCQTLLGGQGVDGFGIGA